MVCSGLGVAGTMGLSAAGARFVAGACGTVAAAVLGGAALGGWALAPVAMSTAVVGLLISLVLATTLLGVGASSGSLAACDALAALGLVVPVVVLLTGGCLGSSGLACSATLFSAAVVAVGGAVGACVGGGAGVALLGGAVATVAGLSLAAVLTAGAATAGASVMVAMGACGSVLVGVDRADALLGSAWRGLMLGPAISSFGSPSSLFRSVIAMATATIKQMAMANR